MTSITKIGILLINLGTPDSPSSSDVKKFLKEFLNDKRVIDLPFLQRFTLVNLLIIPFRYKKTSAAYQKIWQENDSPLRIYSEQLKNALAEELGENYQVEYGFRYGNPSIAAALENLKSCDVIKVLPLFPQYSSAATGSAIEKLMENLSTWWNVPSLEIKNDFYEDKGFINSYAEQIQRQLNNKNIDFLLFSYHGLSERHINKSQCVSQCNRLSACPPVSTENRFCYRAQCYATTHKIASRLGMNSEKFDVAFQSRLGKTPWIKPYTDLLLPNLIQKGVKNLAVVCPSFIADCLETLEEVNIRLRDQWLSLGGKEFVFIPCLNSSSAWVKAVAAMLIS